MLSTSFPLPLPSGTGIEIPVAGVALAMTPGLLLLLVPLSCQAGIEGRAIGGKGLGDEGMPVGRLSNKAFKDFTSCCNSLRDCVWCSLFLSTIYRTLLRIQ